MSQRLQEIKEEIKNLLQEAQDEMFVLCHGVPGRRMTYERAKSYWLPHILMALDSQHDYLGGSMCTMQETINDLESLLAVEEDKDSFELIDEAEND